MTGRFVYRFRFRRDACLPHRLEACATIRVDLLQLVLDLPRVAPSQQHKKIERIIVELKFSFFRMASDDFACFLFPTGATRVQPIKNLDLCAFDQRLVKPASLVHIGSADQKRDLGTDTAVQQLGQFFQRGLHCR